MNRPSSVALPPFVSLSTCPLRLRRSIRRKVTLTPQTYQTLTNKLLLSVICRLVVDTALQYFRQVFLLHETPMGVRRLITHAVSHFFRARIRGTPQLWRRRVRTIPLHFLHSPVYGPVGGVGLGGAGQIGHCLRMVYPGLRESYELHCPGRRRSHRQRTRNIITHVLSSNVQHPSGGRR